MQWQIIVALAVVVPIILVPVLFIWYLNVGGILSAFREARAQRAARKKEAIAEVKVEAK